MRNKGDREYCGHASEQSSIPLSEWLGAIGGKPLKVVILLRLGRVALRVSKGRARLFHFVSARSSSARCEFGMSVFGKR